MNSLRPTAFVAALGLLCSLPATADAVFDFYKLGRGAGDFVSADGVACTGADRCSSNVDAGTRNDDLTFTNGGITVKATGTYLGNTAAVVQDSEASWTSSIGAGLGVYHLSGNNSDDNITAGESLTLTFDRIVHLTGIGLRSDGHNFTAWTSGATFLLDGVSMLLPINVGSIGLDLTAQSFTIAFGGASGDQFYLSSLSASAIAEQVGTVSEPSGMALALGSLGLLGWSSKRRRT